MKEWINLKVMDKSLLVQLYYNSRENAAKIAKQLHISREQVAYRIKKFEELKIIKGYIPLINYSRLGYHLITLIFFRFNRQSYIEKFKDEIKESKNRIITIETFSKYDIGVLFIFKNEKERNDYLSEILNQNNLEISEYQIIEPYFSEFYPLKFLNNNQAQPIIFHEYKSEEYKLDEKEKKVLSVLNKNANARIIDISRATDISAELIIYKLKKLKDENIILTTRAYYNMERIGYFYTIVLINLLNFSKQNQDRLKRFSKNNESVDSITFMLGKPNCYIQIFHKDVSELHSILKNLKQTFPNDSLTIEIIPLKNEGEDVNAIPFL